MKKLEITSLSSRCQIVLPQSIRDNLNLILGDKFVVIAEKDTIILKKLEMLSFSGVESLIKKTKEDGKKN